MLPRPELIHQSISNTVSQENPPESGNGHIFGRLFFLDIFDRTDAPSVLDEGDATPYMLPSRPELVHQPTSSTPSKENPPESGNGDFSGRLPCLDVYDSTHTLSVPDEGGATSYLLNLSIHHTLGRLCFLDAQDNIHMYYHLSVPDTEAGSPLRSNDVRWLAIISVMLVWPWIFLAVIWGLGGLQMNNHLAKVVIDHPSSTSFFVTLLGNIVNIFVGFLFSIAVVRFAQEWVTNNDNVTVFDVSLISAFSNQNFPWSMEDLKYLFIRNRWFSVVWVGVCIIAFAFVPSGMTSLIAPVPFHRTMRLTGSELNISSTAADCHHWFLLHKNDECVQKVSMIQL